MFFLLLQGDNKLKEEEKWMNWGVFIEGPEKIFIVSNSVILSAYPCKCTLIGFFYCALSTWKYDFHFILEFTIFSYNKNVPLSDHYMFYI